LCRPVIATHRTRTVYWTQWRTLIKHHILSTTSFLVVVLLTTPIYAAEPEFKTGLVTASRTYEREQLVRNGGPNGVLPIRVSINRVTVAVEGEHITGEWKPGRVRRVQGSTASALVLQDLKSATRALAREFPGGTSVRAATDRNQLLLKHPDGTVVKAKIVDRVASDGDELERN
jgi:hypothetical protein